MPLTIGDFRRFDALKYEIISWVWYKIYEEAIQSLENKKSWFFDNSDIDLEIASFCHHLSSFFETFQGSSERSDQRDLKYQQKALAVFKRHFGEEHIDTVTSYHKVGTAFAEVGQFELGIENLDKALKKAQEIKEKKPNENSIDILIIKSSNNIAIGLQLLADQYETLGSEKEALDCRKKAFDYRERVLEACKAKFGEDDFRTAVAYDEMGIAFSIQGDYQEAMKNKQKAFAIRKAVLGEEHPHIISSYTKPRK